MRSQQVQDAIDRLFPQFKKNVEKGLCATCGKKIGPFKDDLSLREYKITGCCQDCQDLVERLGD